MNMPGQLPPAEPRVRWRLLVIPFAALIAVAPLIVHGCSCGHDFDFHLLSWMEAARQFSHGNLHPQWAFTPAFNAGEPRFVFYPPISWTLGALLGMLLGHLPGVSEATAWSGTPILFTWMALTLSGLTLFHVARKFASPNASLLAAALYVVNPYILFTAFERTAYAELLAAAWIPLLLYGILREKVTVAGIAVPLALLWLTNAPAAVMGCYTLALLALMRVFAAYRFGRRSRMLAEDRARVASDGPRIAAGTILGMSLAAFYIIPAVYEKRLVQIAMATISGMRIDQNFLFEHTGTSADNVLHDQVLHTVSMIALFLLVTTLITLGANLARRRFVQNDSTLPLANLAILVLGIAFLLTPESLPLWLHAPQAAFLQFPWRLLAIVAPVLALAAAAVLSRVSIRFVPTAIAATLLTIGSSQSAYSNFRQTCDAEDRASARLQLFHSNLGTDPTDEYTPADADNDLLSKADPPDWVAAAPTDPAPAGAQPGPAPLHLTLTAPRAEYLVLNLRAYPTWRVFLNNEPDHILSQRPDGLVAIALPAGTSTIDLRYSHTVDHTIGDLISLLGVTALVLLLRPKRRAAVTSLGG